MKLRKRLVAIMVLPSVTMLISLLITNDVPESRRRMISVFLVYAALAQLVLYSPFAGYFSPTAPRVAAGIGCAYFICFGVLSYFRLENIYAQLAEMAPYSNLAVIRMIAPPALFLFSIGLFILGAAIRYKGRD